LLSICTDERYKAAALKMYKDSLNQDCWYFFAVTGLNITSKLIISLKSYGGLDGTVGRPRASSATSTQGSFIAMPAGSAATDSTA